VKNRITHAWDSIPDPALRAKVKEATARQSQAFNVLLKQDAFPVSLQVLVHIHPFDGRKAFRHWILFLGRFPVVVVSTELIPR
jgi:hypothetical protein